MDSGFAIDNVLGPTQGRVGILYLSGEGEFVLVDEATGAETRQEVRRLCHAGCPCAAAWPWSPCVLHLVLLQVVATVLKDCCCSPGRCFD